MLGLKYQGSRAANFLRGRKGVAQNSSMRWYGRPAVEKSTDPISVLG